jgi:hypothetical protein
VRKLLLMLLLATLVSVSAATSASAYGAANWQLAFSGTITQPGVGGLGFWGWCDFAGGTSFTASGLATAGTSGDCQYAVYVHNALVSATCHESLDLTGWTIGGNGDFFFSGTSTVRPTSETAFCESFPGDPTTPTFTNVDSLIPAVPGHLNLNRATIGGFTFTELQIQNTPLP